MVVTGTKKWELGKMLAKVCKILAKKWICYGDLMNSIVTIVNSNTLIIHCIIEILRESSQMLHHNKNGLYVRWQIY